MSKRPRTEIDDYCRAVEKKERDGVYADADLCGKYSFDGWMKEAQQKEKFTISELLFEGKPTGYAQCSSERCRKQMWAAKQKTIFKIQKGVKSGSAPGLMSRHIDNYHAEKTESAKRTKAQPSITTYAAENKKLSESVVREIRAGNCNVIAETHVSLNHFSKKAVQERDAIMLRAGKYDPTEVKRFDVSGPTCKRDLEKQSQIHHDFLTRVIPELAAKGLIALAIDHKSVLNLKNQKLIADELAADSDDEDKTRPKDALGLQLILTAPDGKRYVYLLEFKPVANKTNAATAKILKEMFKKWNLEDSIDKGRIVIVMDGGNRGLAELINPNGFTETCSFHSLGCLQKRASNQLLEKFDAGFKGKKADIDDFLKHVDDISKEEHKKLPRGSARGINSYLDNLELSNEDRLRICKIERPKGWKSAFEDEKAELSPADEKLKKKLLESKTKMPSIKVKYLPQNTL